MVRGALSAVLVAAAFAGTAFAGAKCSTTQKCPEDTPCCSLYGDCGVGAFCLGGCNPLQSHKFESCVPNPVCKGGKYALDSLDDVKTIDKYLGDPSKTNWQSQGLPAIYTDPNGGQKSTLLTLSQGTSGTLLASTFYVWYGKICARLSTAQGKGVVTAFILMSDVKDEIDFEFIGASINQGLSNFYSQGVTVYTNGKNLTVDGPSTLEMHDYCVDWKQDDLTWYIDGKESRKLERKDTWNATSGRFDYPQTPSRVMLSLWPAGLPTNAKGTVDWAGGEIDWNSPYMQNGYYYARFQEVNVECYDHPKGIQTKGDKSYKYTDRAATNNTIAIANDLVVLGSLMGTGEKPGEAPKSGDSKPTGNVAMVPGGNPGGGNRAEQTSAGQTQPTDASSPNSPQSTNEVGGDSQTTFNQGGDKPAAAGAGSALEPGLGRISGSALAIVIAIMGLITL